MKVGLVGRGRWAGNIRHTLETFDGVEVVLLGGREPAQAGLEVAIVTTPSSTHAEVAQRYLAAGVKRLFIEKPLATSLDDALALGAAAERAGARVFVGHLHL